MMTTVRVFTSGNSQAIRLPKAFRVNVTELEIFRRGDELILREPVKNLAQAFELLADLEMFADGRDDPPPQERDWS